MKPDMARKGSIIEEKRYRFNELYSKKCERKMRPTRLERATYGFEVRCSIQLSYKRIFRHAKNAAYSAAFFIFPHERKKGWVMGFEPTTTRSTIWRSTTELHPPSKTMERLLQITKKKSSSLFLTTRDSA